MQSLKQSLQFAFNEVRGNSITQTRAKVEREKKDQVIFVTKHNTLGPNKHSHILENSVAAKKVVPNGIYGI